MRLYKVTYIEDLHPHSEYETYIYSNGLPTERQLIKRINMIDYCGKEMSDEDYKYFVIELGNYKKYNIEEIEELKFIEFKS